MTNLVIGSLHGGLGDHLFLTPIPEIYKRNFPDSKVFLSSRSKFRQWEIYNLLWQNHPFIDDVVDEDISFNLIKNYEKGSLKNKCPISIICEQLQLKFNQDDLKPLIYSELSNNSFKYEKFKKRLALDLNYISHVGAITNFDIIKIIEIYKENNPILINPSNKIKKKYKSLEVYKTKSLRDYVYLVKNLERLVTFPSGGASLAASLNTSTEVYYGYGFNKLYLHKENINKQINKKNFKNIIMSFILRLKNKMRIYMKK